jgi:formylglycine-generating enzyme required for sulfatase activity
MVVYSASKGQQALDRLDEHDANPNGVFTREFIARMEKPGVRIEELVREVQDAVEDLARTVGHDQRPALYNEARGNFFFFAPTTVQAPGAELNLPVPITPVTASPAAAPDAAPQSFHAFSPELKPGGVFRDCQECPSMVVIPAGTFVMGSDAKEQSLAFPNNAKGAGRESPQHPVSVQRFAAGQYALTKAEFTAFVRATSYKTEAERGGGCVLAGAKGGANNWSNPGFAQGDDHPVVCVSWNDAKAYVQWLSKRTGAPYRLLSESEREYVARAGTITAFWWGDTVHTDQANYDGMAAPYNGSPKGQYRRETVAVSSFDANPFGLYGVHGNVLDWVEDCDNPNYLGAPADGKAWTSGDCDFHMQRGGDWVSEAADLRSAARLTARSDFANAVYGFRVARSIAVNQ